MIQISRPSLGPEEAQAVAEVFRTGWLGLGAVTREFEATLEGYLGCPHVIAVNSGTSALHIALSAFGVGKGDEVIVPSITFAASVQAILATGATPVFCESLEETVLMDLDDVTTRITPRTRAVMPVHYGGSPCDLDALLRLAQAHGFVVVEDAAHAFGSSWCGRPIGSFGHATCFSFDPIKTLTCGEGGAVALADPVLAEGIRRRRLLGIDRQSWTRDANARSWSYDVTSEGFRYHLPNFCAAVGLAQFKKIESFIERRRAICREYDRAFRHLTWLKIRPVDYDSVAPHLYVVRLTRGRREMFTEALAAAGVGTGLHYIANHLQPYFRQFAPVPLPVSERLWQSLVTLPLHCELSDADVLTVIDAVLDAVLACQERVADA